MEPLLYGAKDMKSNGRTLAAPEWKGVTGGVALVTSQHQPASGSGWDIPASNLAASSVGHKRLRPPRPRLSPAKASHSLLLASISRQILGAKGQSSRVTLGIYPGTGPGPGPGLALELTEATDSGP